MHDAEVIKWHGQWVANCSECGLFRFGMTNTKPWVQRFADRHMMEATIQEVVDALCIEYEIPDVKVQIQARLKRVLGRAYVHDRVLGLNETMILSASPEQVNETVRHELAHFIAWDHAGHGGHGLPWVTACQITGAIPSPLYQEVTGEYPPNTRWLYTCAEGCVFPAHQRKQRWLTPKFTCKTHHLPLREERYEPYAHNRRSLCMSS